MTYGLGGLAVVGGLFWLLGAADRQGKKAAQAHQRQADDDFPIP
jgi:hypothetical protein